MNTSDAAWLAGFFDGEGSLTSYPVRSRYIGWKLSVPNTHLGSLEKCQRITGMGSVFPVNRKTKHDDCKRKPIWHWSVNNRKDIAAILREIVPYLVIKSDKARRFLDEYDARTKIDVSQPLEETGRESVQ